MELLDLTFVLNSDPTVEFKACRLEPPPLTLILNTGRKDHD